MHVSSTLVTHVCSLGSNDSTKFLESMLSLISFGRPAHRLHIREELAISIAEFYTVDQCCPLRVWNHSSLWSQVSDRFVTLVFSFLTAVLTRKQLQGVPGSLLLCDMWVILSRYTPDIPVWYSGGYLGRLLRRLLTLDSMGASLSLEKNDVKKCRHY
jgi:hypothetical protein